MRRALAPALLLVTLALTGCAGSGHVRSTTGPGSGFLTPTASYVRPLRPDVRITPILTAGDTLYPDDPARAPFVFAGRAGGLGVRDRGDGTAEVYVSHEDAWLDGVEGALISRLVLDLRNSGVLDADDPLRPDRGYQGFAHAAMLDSRIGFLRPEFVVNERGHNRRLPLVAAMDALNGTMQDLPWLGAMRHKSTIALPGTSMPMPIPVGDGTSFLCLVPSSSVSAMPIAVPTSSASTAPCGSADRPPDKMRANPAKRCEIGDWSPLSPPMPYVLRSSGYTSATAPAPTGTAMSCEYVR